MNNPIKASNPVHFMLISGGEGEATGNLYIYQSRFIWLSIQPLRRQWDTLRHCLVCIKDNIKSQSKPKMQKRFKCRKILHSNNKLVRKILVTLGFVQKSRQTLVLVISDGSFIAKTPENIIKWSFKHKYMNKAGKLKQMHQLTESEQICFID